MNKSYRTELTRLMLETVDDLDEGIEIVGFGFPQFTIEQIREVAKDCIDVDCFILNLHVDNDRNFIVSFAGLSAIGKELLADLRTPQRDLQQVNVSRLYAAWRQIPDNERIPYRDWIRKIYTLSEEIDIAADGTAKHRLMRLLTDQGRAELDFLERFLD